MEKPEEKRNKEKRISKHCRASDQIQYTTGSGVSAIKATMSKDGYPRFDIRITHRVGVMEIITYLGLEFTNQIRDEGIASLPKKLTRARIIDIVKDQSLFVGLYYLDGWSDDLTWEETEKLSEWARNVVLRAFPELTKDESK